MSLHNATSQQAQRSFFCPFFPPGLSSVVRCLSRKRRLKTEDLMEVLSPACSGGVPRAEGSSVPVGKGGAPRFQDPARVGLAAPPWAHWLRAGSRVPSERRVWMDKPWRPISRGAVTNSPNTEAVLYVSWCGCWGWSGTHGGPWPRLPTCGPAHRTAALILWLLPGPISASLVLSLG